MLKANRLLYCILPDNMDYEVNVTCEMNFVCIYCQNLNIISNGYLFSIIKKKKKKKIVLSEDESPSPPSRSVLGENRRIMVRKVSISPEIPIRVKTSPPKSTLK